MARIAGRTGGAVLHWGSRLCVRAAAAALEYGYATVLAFLAAALILYPAVQPGYVLLRDMVFVPNLTLGADVLGYGRALPRAVPSDAVVAVLDDVIPGSALQKVLLLTALMLWGLGVSQLSRAFADRLQRRGVWRLSERATLVLTAAAAVGGIWNPFVLQRLAIGHWALLLGTAAVPWLLAGWVQQLPEHRTGLVAWRRVAPAVVWSAWTATSGAMVMVGVALWCVTRRGLPVWTRAGLVTLAASVNAPWIVAGVRHPGPSGASDIAVAAFAVNADHVAGPLLSLLVGGGIWNAAVVLPSAKTPLAVAVSVLVLVLAALSGAQLLRAAGQVAKQATDLRDDQTSRGTRWCAMLCDARSMSVVWWVVLCTAVPVLSLTTVGQSVLSGLGAGPGGGLLRDAQKWAAPWSACVWALWPLGAGLLVGRSAPTTRLPASVAALGIALLPIIAWPDGAAGLAGRLQPRQYPTTTLQAAHVARSIGGTGMILPWSAYVIDPTISPQPVLDPLPRLVGGDVWHSSDLHVAGRIHTDGDDTGARAAAAIQAGRPAEINLNWVIFREPDGTGRCAQLGWRSALSADDLTVCRAVGDHIGSLHGAIPAKRATSMSAVGAAYWVAAAALGVTLLAQVFWWPRRRSYSQGDVTPEAHTATDADTRTPRQQQEYR